ncbi:MAG: hypothetical protein H7249_17920 [Chitinophagaceae bacterium]|nr:hypothetical protein [Oligoflexus sp.]
MQNSEDWITQALRPLDLSEQMRFKMAIEAAPLSVFHNKSGQYASIPASTRPVIVAASLWNRIASDAELILSAMEKVMVWLCRDEQKLIFESLFGQLSPLERLSARSAPNRILGLVTARLDLFFDGDELSVIEVNTTIPAMQAYSDMIRSALFNAWNVPKTVSRQSNTKDLLTALLWHYQRAGGKKANPHIAIIARAGDSQLAELKWLQREWQDSGFAVLLLRPEDLTIKNQSLWNESTPIDLVYRHIFAHRLSPHSPFAAACLNSELYKVFNPISAHLEAKGLLAQVSRIAADDTLSLGARLNEAERNAVNSRVVWSRPMAKGLAHSPELEALDDLIDWVKNNKVHLVIKSSFGYGGKGVYIGSNFEDEATQLRVQTLLSAKVRVTWSDFVDFCERQGEGQWVVQKKIHGRKIKHEYRAKGEMVEELALTDCSIFTSFGAKHLTFGGACRFSTESIVNIGQGGGLAPLLLDNELESLVRYRKRDKGLS